MKRIPAFALALCTAALPAFSAEWFVWKDCPTPGDGSTTNTAKSSIAAALKISSLQNGDIVTVLPGEYDQETMNDGWALPNRVYITKSITLRSRDGAATTHIVGEFGPNPKGNGNGGVRCIEIAADNVVVQGFTLRNGATRNNSLDHASCQGAGVLFNGKNSSYVVDCVISNCAAGSGGAAACTSDALANSNALVRTLVLDNRADKNRAVRSVALYHCVVAGHHETSYPQFYGSGNIVNCTLFDNHSHHLFDGGSPIVCNTVIGKYCYTHASASGAVFSNCVSSIQDNTNLRTDSNFIAGYRSASSWQMVAPAFGDYRPYGGMPAATAGSAEHLSLIPETYRWRDLNGRDFSNASSVCAGAVQEVATATGGYVSFAGQANEATSSSSVPLWQANGRVPYGSADVLYMRSDRWPAVFRAEVRVPDGKPALFGFRCTDGAAATMRVPLYDDDAGIEVVANPKANQGIFLTPLAADALYYVAKDGNDANAGTEESPFASIGAAVAAAAVGEYTVIRVKAGVYAETGARASEEDVKSSIVLPNGKFIRLVAVEGPEKTVIEGAPDPDSAAVWQNCGINATRCVTIGTNCVVQGFTFRNGHAASGALQGVTSLATSGGAVRAEDATSQIVDCVATNCFAGRGGAGMGGTWLRCRIGSCQADYLGSAIYSAWAYNCFVDGNRGQGCIYNFKTFTASTIGPDNLTLGDGRYAEISGIGSTVYDSLLMGFGTANGTLRHCVYPQGYDMPEGHVWKADSLAADPAALAMNGTSPAVGANQAVDFMEPSAVESYPWGFCGFYDVDRRPRVVNGKMDAGAAEADWRDAYGRTLGGRRCVVEHAAPWIVAPGDGTVRIPKGTLDVLWTRRSHGFSFVASVTGNGRLIVLADGTEVAKVSSSDGETTVRFTSDSPVVAMSLTYFPGVGDIGAAVLSKFANNDGMAFYIR
ncbi:MAG: hypothetical protein IKO72_09225 [Kiritimatiellae bacterium]|nr:hypothetical protein [Kiritimatiellia bacterium]